MAPGRRASLRAKRPIWGSRAAYLGLRVAGAVWNGAKIAGGSSATNEQVLVTRVFHRVQEQPLSRSGGTGGGASTGGKDRRDIGRLEAAAAHVEHGTDQVADHVVKETVAADTVDEENAGIREALFRSEEHTS